MKQNWSEIIALKNWLILYLEERALKEHRILTIEEKLERDNYLDQIRRYSIYKTIGI